jgi:hypothetical protein
MATYRSHKTYRSLLLSSRWSNSLVHNSNSVSTFIIRLANDRTLGSFNAFLANHPEQAVHIRRISFYLAESDADIQAQLDVLKQCHMHVESLSCCQDLLLAYLSCELWSPNLRGLTMDLRAFPPLEDGTSSIPREMTYRVDSQPNLTTVYYRTSLGMFQPCFPRWPNIRTLVLSEPLFSHVSRLTSKMGDEGEGDSLSWIVDGSLPELEEVVCVCSYDEGTQIARARYRDEPTALDNAIRGKLGHNMRIVSPKMNTFDELSNSWKDELIV